MANKVISIESGSLAATNGLKAGIIIAAINNNRKFDIIDYLIATAEDNICLDYIDIDGTQKQANIKNDFSAPLGLSFEHITIDSPRRCANRCIFCFMDQMPKGMRESLYFRDDDYRLSFMCGNYITLTNLSEKELDRIISLKMSPLNISVHVTQPTLRSEMMRNKAAGNIMKQLSRLKEGNIDFNLQLVLCPDYNDKEQLINSLDDIMTLLPNVKSLSCVPVGLTKYRKDLTPLRSFTKEEAREVIETLYKYSVRVKNSYADICFCASDEFFVLADEPIKEAFYYGDYVQFENGVGMLRSFIDDIDDFIASTDEMNRVNAVLITGVLANEFLKNEIDKLNAKYGTLLEVVCIKNDYFGEKVTAAGLVCGCDIIKQLKDVKIPNILFIPSNMMKDDEDVFLDDMTLDNVARELNKMAYRVPSDGYEFCEYIKEF